MNMGFRFGNKIKEECGMKPKHFANPICLFATVFSILLIFSENAYAYEYGWGIKQATNDSLWSGYPRIDGNNLVRLSCREQPGRIWGVLSAELLNLASGKQTRIADNLQMFYPGGAPRVCSGTDRFGPKISGNYVVLDNPSYYGWRVYLYDIAKGELRIASNSTARRDHKYPAILGKKIFWNDNWNAMIEYDIEDGTELAISNNTAGVPRVFGNYIVWGGEEGYIYDPETKTTSYLGDNPVYQRYKSKCIGNCPLEATGDIFAYEKSLFGMNEVYLHNIFDNTEARVTFNNKEELRPFFDKDQAVWAANLEGNFSIYLQNLETHPLEFAAPRNPWLTFNISKKGRPRVSGDYVVFAETAQPSCGIHLLSISSGDEGIFGPCGSDFPSISGDIVAFHRNLVTYPPGRGRVENYDIYFHRISTGETLQLTNNSAEQSYPDVFGNRIIWVDKRSGNFDIYMFDLTTLATTRVSSLPGSETNPRIEGNRITYQFATPDLRYGGINVYDIESGNTTNIVTNNFPTNTPVIYGDIVAWREYWAPGQTLSFHYHNLSSGEQKRFRTIKLYDWDLAHGGRRGYLSIHGEVIVWEDINTTIHQIYMYHIPSGKTVQLTNTGGTWVYPNDVNYDQVSPAVYESTVVWASADKSKSSEYAFTGSIFQYDISQFRFPEIRRYVPYARPSPWPTVTPRPTVSIKPRSQYKTTPRREVPTKIPIASGKPRISPSPRPTWMGPTPATIQSSSGPLPSFATLRPTYEPSPGKRATDSPEATENGATPKAGGVPSSVWIVGLLIVAAVAYFIYTKKIGGVDESEEG